jgi:hypothetical protein
LCFTTKTVIKLVAPKLADLYNHIAYYKKVKYGKNFTIGELCEYLDSHSAVPDDEDEPFIVHFESLLDDDTDFENGDVIRYYLTTKRLIRLSQHISNGVLQADGTYKLTWQQFPVLIIGVSDQLRHFHPLGLSLVSREKTNDYKFIFTALCTARAQLELPGFENVSLMADAADSITNGFVAVFGEQGVRAMCWYHARTAMFKPTKLIKDNLKRSTIESEIAKLQVLQTNSIFEKAVRLFYDKYISDRFADVVEFVRYFKAEWMDSHPNWYEGYMNSDDVKPHGSVANNNGLEATNGDVKESHTLREQLPIGTWIEVSTNIVRT